MIIEPSPSPVLSTTFFSGTFSRFACRDISFSFLLRALCALCGEIFLIAVRGSVPAHALVPAAGGEDFAEPIAAQLRVELAINDHRSAALIEPCPQPFKVSDVADGDSIGAHRPGDGGKVIVPEESPMPRQADVLEQMHLRAIGRIVEDDDERRNLITHESLELAETHHEPAIPRGANGQTVGVGDRGAEGGSQA